MSISHSTVNSCCRPIWLPLLLNRLGCNLLLLAGLSVGFPLSIQAQTPAPIPATSQAQALNNRLPASGAMDTPSGKPITAETHGVAAKKPGVTHIGVVEPRVDFGHPGSSTTAAGEPLRTLIIRYLSGPAIDAVPIYAMLPEQVSQEAEQKECDYVLVSSLTEKANHSGLGLLRKAAPFAAIIPGVGAVAALGVMVAGTASAVSNAATLSGLVKAKSEVIFEYQLIAPDSKVSLLTDTAKVKAKNDGEDVITPLVVQADTAILAKLSNKK